jgi:hypothetical protein
VAITGSAPSRTDLGQSVRPILSHDNSGVHSSSARVSRRNEDRGSLASHRAVGSPTLAQAPPPPIEKTSEPICRPFSHGPGRDRTCDLGIKSAGRRLRRVSAWWGKSCKSALFLRHKRTAISEHFGGSCYHFADTLQADAIARRHHEPLPIHRAVRRAPEESRRSWASTKWAERSVGALGVSTSDAALRGVERRRRASSTNMAKWTARVARGSTTPLRSALILSSNAITVRSNCAASGVS